MIRDTALRAVRCAAVWLVLAVIPTVAPAQDTLATGGDSVRLIDDFSTLAGWEAVPSPGGTLRIAVEGAANKALRLDLDFDAASGVAVVRKRVELDLPERYALRFRTRGTIGASDLEIRLVDAAGGEVSASALRNFDFARTWREVSRKSRHFAARGERSPRERGRVSRVRDLEIAIRGSKGGKGTVWIDDLALVELPPAIVTPPLPVATATRSAPGHEAWRAVDGDSTTGWRGMGPARLDIDLGAVREFGGIHIRWEEGRIPFAADVQTSTDGVRWTTARRIRGNLRSATPVRLPDHEARHVRLEVRSAVSGVREVSIEPLDWAPTPDDLLRRLAANAPRGWYPRAVTDGQARWTVFGVAGDRRNGILGGDGAIEAGREGFTVEPFVVIDSTLHTWSNVETEQSLTEGTLPLPSVTWRSDAFTLRIAAFAAGAPGSSRLHATYTLTNLRGDSTRATLVLALRPMQVAPPTPAPDGEGGVAPVDSVVVERGVVRVNGNRIVAAVLPPDRAMALPFDGGDVAAIARRGVPSGATRASDGEGLASALMAWDTPLPAYGERVVALEIPLHEPPRGRAFTRRARTLGDVETARLAAIAAWDSTLSRVSISLPDTLNGRAIGETLRASLGHLLVRGEGSRVPPERRPELQAWVRDGALASSALLGMGQEAAVRELATAVARALYDGSGQPCCGDRASGAVPQPSRDPHGEFIVLVADHFRHTRDRAFAERMWPYVAKAVEIQDSLRQQGQWASVPGEPLADLFALRGYGDAAMLAEALGEAGATRYRELHDDLATRVAGSIARAVREGRGNAGRRGESGSTLDATSAAIALSLTRDDRVLPRGALPATFERYWREVDAGRRGRRARESLRTEEMRTAGAFVRLGQPERAHALLGWFLTLQRPPGWRQWPEVVPGDSAAALTGEMPHAGAASAFIRSALDLFAYTRESDSSLVVGAGVHPQWLAGGGVRLRGLGTEHGALDLEMRDAYGVMEIVVSVERLPAGGIVVRPPVGTRFTSVRADGGEIPREEDGSVRLHQERTSLMVSLAPARR